MSAQRRSSTVNRRARGAATRRGAAAAAPAAPVTDGAVSVATEPVTTGATTAGASRGTPKMANRAEVPGNRRRRLDGVRRYLQDTRAELRRVTWPDQITVRNLTAVVIAVSAVMGILLGGIDFVLLRLFEAI
ncbi:MAG TPA: preprotein translocase subunit SecE [Thermomicrobiales bacterium]|nr:preprotein translocase subunit SecE [Thermomicrobiales bacterium]